MSGPLGKLVGYSGGFGTGGGGFIGACQGLRHGIRRWHMGGLSIDPRRWRGCDWSEPKQRNNREHVQLEGQHSVSGGCEVGRRLGSAGDRRPLRLGRRAARRGLRLLWPDAVGVQAGGCKHPAHQSAAVGSAVPEPLSWPEPGPGGRPGLHRRHQTAPTRPRATSPWRSATSMLIQAEETGTNIMLTPYDPKAWDHAARPTGPGTPGAGAGASGSPTSGLAMAAGAMSAGGGYSEGGAMGSTNEADAVGGAAPGGGGMMSGMLGNSGGFSGSTGGSSAGAAGAPANLRGERQTRQAARGEAGLDRHAVERPLRAVAAGIGLVEYGSERDQRRLRHRPGPRPWPKQPVPGWPVLVGEPAADWLQQCAGADPLGPAVHRGHLQESSRCVAAREVVQLVRTRHPELELGRRRSLARTARKL